jgi:peptidoglycan hydrolase-like protein with peptidoglycan-binding domain
MNPNSKTVWTRIVFIFLATGTLGLSLTSLGFAANPEEEKPAVSHRQDITKVQESLRDKGYYHGQVDGVVGPQTREAIRQYQKSENLPVSGRLDGETAGKLGVGPESVGGSFESAGHEVGKGGKELGHEMKKGKPIAAGKEMGKGLGRGGKDLGKAVKKAASTDSDRGDREKKEQPEKTENPQ